MKLKDIKQKVNLLEPTGRRGKFGITDAIKSEILSQLKKKKIVKVRFLKAAKPEDSKNFARQLATEINAVLVQQIGSTITLYKEK